MAKKIYPIGISVVGFGHFPKAGRLVSVGMVHQGWEVQVNLQHEVGLKPPTEYWREHREVWDGMQQNTHTPKAGAKILEDWLGKFHGVKVPLTMGFDLWWVYELMLREVGGCALGSQPVDIQSVGIGKSGVMSLKAKNPFGQLPNEPGVLVRARALWMMGERVTGKKPREQEVVQEVPPPIAFDTDEILLMNLYREQTARVAQAQVRRQWLTNDTAGNTIETPDMQWATWTATNTATTAQGGVLGRAPTATFNTLTGQWEVR